MTGLFNYSVEQHENIRRGQHPDCCIGDVCAHCGASEDNLLACGTNLSAVALDCFQWASACARNANIKSIGQWTRWETNDAQARVFDAAGRALATPSTAPTDLPVRSPQSFTAEDNIPPALGMAGGEGIQP